MYTSEEVLALSFVPGMKVASIRSLSDAGIPFPLLRKTADETLARHGLRSKTIAALRSDDPYRREATAQLERAAGEGVDVIAVTEPRYPIRLREIYSPPAVLWVRGALGDLEGPDASGPTIAVVGTRAASTYGRLASERYASTFVRAGITLVSGLARGIDTYAHEEVVKLGGRTVAVVASGLDRIQPSTAERLADKIAEHGAVVTEHRFGVRALRPYFPQRNRIISGLSAATLVVESDVKGGAMITARFALDQNREVFALPGPVTSPKSAGTNRLIRTDRARLTQSPEDVLEELGYRIASESSPDPSSAPADLDIFERTIFEKIGPEPTLLDDLCEATGVGSSELLVALLSLEFKGCVRQLVGKRFVRV